MERFESSELLVLVVDDDKTTAELLRRLLTAMGAKEVLIARDGAEGLRLACDKLPDLVVCDIGMKPVDGLAFLGGLKASIRADVATIPVVMFSAVKEGDAAERAKALGAAGFLAKPFNPVGLAAVLKEVLAEGVVQPAS